MLDDIVKMREAGLTWEQIGFKLRITKQAAHQYYKRKISSSNKLTVTALARIFDITRHKMEQVLKDLALSLHDPKIMDILKNYIENIKCLECGELLPSYRVKFCCDKCYELYTQRKQK